MRTSRVASFAFMFLVLWSRDNAASAQGTSTTLPPRFETPSRLSDSDEVWCGINRNDVITAAYWLGHVDRFDDDLTQIVAEGASQPARFDIWATTNESEYVASCAAARNVKQPGASNPSRLNDHVPAPIRSIVPSEPAIAGALLGGVVGFFVGQLGASRQRRFALADQLDGAVKDYIDATEAVIANAAIADQYVADSFREKARATRADLKLRLRRYRNAEGRTLLALREIEAGEGVDLRSNTVDVESLRAEKAHLSKLAETTERHARGKIWPKIRLRLPFELP